MKKTIIFIFLFLIMSILNLKINALENNLAGNSKASYLLEASTGKVLYASNENEHLGIASMTKMMTLTIVFDYIRDDKVELTDILTTSENAKSMGGSQAYLEVGEKHTLEELIKCVCIASANDAAVTMAEHLCGTEAMFVSKMNEKVTALGLSDTNFIDCTGLTDINHYSTAYDMAMIGRNLVVKYPEILEYTSIKEDYIRKDTDSPFWLVNTNKILGIGGIDGLKTGWTSSAGYCITTTAIKNDMRLVGVLMGYESPSIRNKEAVELLNYGFSNYKYKKIYCRNEIIKEEYSILYDNDKISYVVEDDINILLNSGEEYDVNITYEKNKGLIEIISNGEVIAKSNIIILENKKSNIFKIILKVLKIMV